MTICFETPTDAYYFFGYFDKSPFDGEDRRLLAQRVGFMDRMPVDGEPLEIGYFNWRESNEFVKVAESRAWNWQTGCMAQWLGPGFDREILYNDRDKDGLCTIRLDVESGARRRYPVAVGGADRQGRYALSVDYEHMARIREGYGLASSSTLQSHDDEETGIWRLDLDSGGTDVVVSLARVKVNRPQSSMATSVHMLDNPLFNPSGDRFAFFHRWRLPDGSFYTRLYVASSDGDELTLLHDTGRVSHINWRNDREIVAFLGWETAVNRLRKNPRLTRYVLRPLVPVYHLFVGNHWQVSRKIRGDGYALIDVETGTATRFDAEALDRDGHPSFAPDRPAWMLTDTYPDWRQKAKLLLVNVETQAVHEVDMVRSVRQYDETELRCDLHPRWSRDGRFVCIDNMEGGQRSMRVYDVSAITTQSSPLPPGEGQGEGRKVHSP